MATLPIIVYGNGDMYQELFNAIAAAFSDSAYGILLKIALCLSGTWAMVRYSTERSLMPLTKWLLTYYLAFYVIFIPKVRVEIIDQVNAGQVYAIDNIPLGLATIAHLTSSIGAGLTSLIEKTFSLPDDLLYGHTGMVMASRLVYAATQFKISDANFQQSLQGFVHQCVFYDVLLNKYSWNDLLTTPNLWQFVGANASPARAFLYVTPGASRIMTCRDGYAKLTQAWTGAIQSAAGRYGAQLFPNASDAKAQFLAYLPESYQFLTQSSDDAASVMQQTMFANALQDGTAQIGAETGSNTAMEAYAFAKAQMQKRQTNQTVGDMAAYWLPLMKNVFEAIAYGSFLFIFLLLLFPFGPSVLKIYVASLMWLQIWAPMYAILNLFMNFYAHRHSLAALNLGNGTTALTLSSQNGLAQANADVAGLAGYLTISVPLLGAMLTKGMMSVFTQAAQYIAGVTQSAAASAAGEAVTGNISLGNTNFSNHSSLNTSANHFDTNARVTSGLYSAQMPGGSSLSVSPNGALVMNTQNAISSLGTSVRMSHTLQSAFMQQAEASETAALNSAHSYASSTSDVLRKLVDVSHQKGTTLSSRDSSSVSLSADMSHSVADVDNITSNFSKRYNMSWSDASTRLTSAAINGGASGGINTQGMTGGVNLDPVNASANLGVNLSGSATHQRVTAHDEIDAAAQETVKNSSYSHSLNQVMRGVSEQGISFSGEDGHRIVEGINSAYEQAQQARNEMTSSLQQAQSYREGASYTETHADSIDTNASQAYFEHLQVTGGNLREIETMQTRDPAAAQASGDAYVHDAVDRALNEWKGQHNIDAATVHAADTMNNAHINNSTTINQDAAKDNAIVTATARQQGLMGNVIDTKSQSQTKQILDKTQSALEQKSAGIKQSIDNLDSPIAQRVEKLNAESNKKAVAQAALAKELDDIKSSYTKPTSENQTTEKTQGKK